MEQFNFFVLSLNNRMQHLPLEVRQRRMKTILEDLEKTYAFTPIEELVEEDEEDFLLEEEEEAFESSLTREQRIRQLISLYSKTPLNEETDEDRDREHVIKKRKGNQDFHDAVRMDDEALMLSLHESGASPHEKNNSGYSAVELAFLEENDKAISFFRKYGYIQEIALS